jgi:hydroxypyruvate reductase
MVAPHPPLTLDDKIELNARLLASGGDIHQINAIRRLVSQIKGGRLATMAAPAQITQFIISDVENDQLSSIGSGIMAPDPMPVSESLALIETLGMADLWWVADLHKQYADDRMIPPLSPDHPICNNIDSHILASNKQVIHDGIIPPILSSLLTGKDQNIAAQPPQIIAYPRLSGEASVMAEYLAEATISAVHQTGKPVMGITGGETVVTLPHDHGLGGRSQELALAFAVAFKTAMQGSDMPWLILAAGTDGRDGPTDAAGAMLDNQMPLDIASAKQALQRHDVWNYLNQSGGLFRPGASGTNLADLVVIIAG